MKIIFKLLFLIFSANTAFAQSNISVGQKAPDIVVTDWIKNTPTDKDLTNKFIVLEFWATWCGPCIAAVPHMNELQKEFEGDNLYFVSITDESVAKVERSLKRIDFKSIVVTDTTKATQIEFGDGEKGLEAYPFTVMIDNEGIISWIGTPKELTSEVLSSFLKKQEEPIQKTATAVLKNEATEKKQDFMSLFGNKELDFYFQIDRSNGEGEFRKKAIGNNLIQANSANLVEIYNNVLKINITEANIPSQWSDRKFNFLYKNSRDKEKSLQILEDELLKSLELEKKVETNEQALVLITVSNEELLEKTLETRFSAKSDADGKIVFTAFTIDNLVQELNQITDQKLEFKGDDEAQYDFIIPVGSDEVIFDGLESYGLSTQKTIAKKERITLVGRAKNDTTTRTKDVYQVVETVLDEYQGLDFVFCSKPLDYNVNSITTQGKLLIEALDLDLIANFQEWTSTGDAVPIKDILSKKDLEYMKSQINSAFEWEKEKLAVKVISCEKLTDNIRLKFSKPLFNKEKNLSLVFREQSSVADYSNSLILLKKEDGHWKREWSLNM